MSELTHAAADAAREAAREAAYRGGVDYLVRHGLGEAEAIEAIRGEAEAIEAIWGAGDYWHRAVDPASIFRAWWRGLDTPIELVYNEYGVNVAGAQMRALGDGRWLYADDQDGFHVLDGGEADDLLALGPADDEA